MKVDLEKDFISLIGEEGYIRYLETNGGVKTYIPKTSSGSRLESEIGVNAAKKLAKEYGGEHITTPLSKRFLVKFYRNKGKSIRWVSLRLRMSERNVGKICQNDG